MALPNWVAEAAEVLTNVLFYPCSMWNNVINAWWPLIFYPATDAPKFKKGMYAMIGVCIATLAITWTVWRLEKREKQLAMMQERQEKSKDSVGAGDKKYLE